jgi:hypothetical protein
MRSSASIPEMESLWRASCSLSGTVAGDSLERHVGTPTLEADLGPLRGSCRSTFPPKCLSDLRLRLAGMCRRDNRAKLLAI